MKRKLRSAAALFCTIILLLPFLGGATGVVWGSETDRIQTLADEILAAELAGRESADLQSFADGYLTENAGMDVEWWILTLRQSGAEFDAKNYRSALTAYLRANPPIPAAAKQRCALALIVIGAEDDPYVSRVVDETVGKGGIVSFIFGLHLLNGGAPSANYTADGILDTLLSRRLTDGGWALSGTNSDVDVTAMCVQAMAPHADRRADVREAVMGAISLLAQKQLADGDYQSYGVPNPESGAQVILALSAAGVDPLTDARFVKNGNTLLDGLLKYRLPEGGFTHTAGGAYNAMATVQTHMALTAILRQSRGEGGFYPVEAPEAAPPTVPPSGEATAPPVTASAPATEPSAPPSATTAGTTAAPTTGTVTTSSKTSSEADPGERSGGISYKAVGVAIVLILAAAACAILYLTRRRSPGNFILVALIGAGLILILCLTNIQSTKDYYKPEDTAAADQPSVLLSIRCDVLVGIADSEYIPADGVILPETKFTLSEGETVYDILIRAAKSSGIGIQRSGAPGMAYIAGIGNLYEFDYGDLSGWTYYVNGESPSVSCEAYTLSDGDRIEWKYTLTVGTE